MAFIILLIYFNRNFTFEDIPYCFVRNIAGSKSGSVESSHMVKVRAKNEWQMAENRILSPILS
jgi:hypothetical protein